MGGLFLTPSSQSNATEIAHQQGAKRLFALIGMAPAEYGKQNQGDRLKAPGERKWQQVQLKKKCNCYKFANESQNRPKSASPGSKGSCCFFGGGNFGGFFCNIHTLSDIFSEPFPSIFLFSAMFWLIFSLLPSFNFRLPGGLLFGQWGGDYLGPVRSCKRCIWNIYIKKRGTAQEVQFQSSQMFYIISLQITIYNLQFTNKWSRQALPTKLSEGVWSQCQSEGGTQ